MKMTMAWRGNKKTRKPVRVAHKPKIRWDQLGFVGSLDAQDPYLYRGNSLTSYGARKPGDRGRYPCSIG